MHNLQNSKNYRNQTWSLNDTNPGEEFPNYLTKNEVSEYDRLNNIYVSATSGPLYNDVTYSYTLAAEVDCRNLIRHIISLSDTNTGKKEYYFEVTSKRGSARGEFILSGGQARQKNPYGGGGWHDPFTVFKKCAKKELPIHIDYPNHDGTYGEILIGDGSHILKFWSVPWSDSVKIGIKNLNGEFVDKSVFRNVEMTEKAGFEYVAKVEEKMRVRFAEEAEQRYLDSIPSDMTYDADGKPEWGTYRAEKRQEKASEQAAFQSVIKTLADPNSHIYQNNRAPNLAENYKPTPDEERYGTSYQEFSKPTGDTQGDNKYIPASKISTTKNNNQNTFSNEPNDSAKNIETPTVKMLIPIRVKVDKGESMPDKYSASTMLASQLYNKAHDICHSKHNGRLTQFITGKAYASGSHGPFTCNIVRTDWYQCSGELTVDCELR
jgi:hypothetical protein